MSTDSSFNWRSHVGEEITVVIPRYPLFEIFQGIHHLTPQFEKETGIRVHLNTVDSCLAPGVIESSIKEKSGQIDAFLQPLNHATYRFYSKGLLEPLSSYIANPHKTDPDYDLDDIDPRLISTARYDGDCYGIPLLFESYLLMYNRRLVNKYLGGRLPETMSDLILAAQRVTRESDSKIYGAVVRGVRSSGPIDTVSGVIFNSYGSGTSRRPYNLWFADSWDRPSIDDPNIVRGLKEYAELLKSGPEDAFKVNWDRAAQMFQQGNVMFFVDASQFTVYFEGPGSAVAADTGYAMLPPIERGGRSCTGYWALGWLLSKNSRQKDPAWLYIQYMSQKFADVVIGMYTAGAVRGSTWRNPRYIRTLNPEYHRVVLESLENCRSTTVENEKWDAMAAIIMSTVQQISRGVDPDQAAKAANRKIAKIAKGEGYGDRAT